MVLGTALKVPGIHKPSAGFDGDSPRYMDNVPEATPGLLGTIWLLEMARMPLEPELKPVGAEKPPVSRLVFPVLLCSYPGA